ncbi:MAG: glycosyltransferase [Acidimicrobiales bacterium]
MGAPGADRAHAQRPDVGLGGRRAPRADRPHPHGAPRRGVARPGARGSAARGPPALPARPPGGALPGDHLPPQGPPHPGAGLRPHRRRAPRRHARAHGRRRVGGGRGGRRGPGLGRGDQVRRTGRIPWADLDALYELAAAVAVPSRFEGFGAPALEAMAAGSPLVAADATALPWVVDDGGLLVPVGDAAAWAEALARLLDDPAERARLAAAGRQRAASFSWDRAGRALAAGYRQAVAVGEDGAS